MFQSCCAENVFCFCIWNVCFCLYRNNNEMWFVVEFNKEASCSHLSKHITAANNRLEQIFCLIIYLWLVSFLLLLWLCYSCRVTGKFHRSSRLFPEKHVYFGRTYTHLPLCLAPPPAGMIDRFPERLIVEMTGIAADCRVQPVACLLTDLLIVIDKC